MFSGPGVCMGAGSSQSDDDTDDVEEDDDEDRRQEEGDGFMRSTTPLAHDDIRAAALILSDRQCRFRAPEFSDSAE